MEIFKKEKHQIYIVVAFLLTKQTFDDDDIFDVSVWNFYPNCDD